jgi:hypothetical protein
VLEQWQRWLPTSFLFARLTERPLRAF